MKQKKDFTRRISLLLLTSGVVMILLLVTALLVGVVILNLVNSGSLQYGDVGLDGWSLFFNLILWSFVIGAVLTFFILRFPLIPVNRTLSAMNKLAEGDYSVRLSFKGAIAKHPAVSELTDSFNAMASELEQTEMLRSDFINNFSHEFKTPIVSIAGFAKVLKRGNVSEKERTEYLTIIEEESMRLAQMATNVLDLTKVENQTILTDENSFNLSEQLRTCVLMLESKWSKKSLELIMPTDEKYITGSEELLKQVWMNLLDNAVKFTPENGRVEIRVEEDADAVCVKIMNSGEMIPEEIRDKIFNKFYQGDESHATEGNGIGLAVVKRIVQLHSGAVEAGREEDMTVFAVRLPKK